MVKVTKETTFDCAHMLSGHKGKCQNLHGHTYKVQVEITGEPIKRADDSSKGMVIDFSDLKEIIKVAVTDPFDHAIIFSDEYHRGAAEQALYDWAMRYGMHLFVMPGRTTSEMMATYFRMQVCLLLGQKGLDYHAVHVRVWETPTSFAEV